MFTPAITSITCKAKACEESLTSRRFFSLPKDIKCWLASFLYIDKASYCTMKYPTHNNVILSFLSAHCYSTCAVTTKILTLSMRKTVEDTQFAWKPPLNSFPRVTPKGSILNDKQTWRLCGRQTRLCGFITNYPQMIRGLVVAYALY